MAPKKKREPRSPEQKAKARKLRQDESVAMAWQGAPTTAIPGSEEKILAMIERASKHGALFVEADADTTEDRRLDFVRASNTFVKAMGTASAEDGENIPENNSDPNVTSSRSAHPGDRMRSARQSAGLSLRALARRTGLSDWMLGAVERRETAPSLWTIYRVSLALFICPDWLAGLSAVEPARAVRTFQPEAEGSEETRRAVKAGGLLPLSDG